MSKVTWTAVGSYGLEVDARPPLPSAWCIFPLSALLRVSGGPLSSERVLHNCAGNLCLYARSFHSGDIRAYEIFLVLESGTEDAKL